MNLTIPVSESLYRRAVEIASAEHVPVEELFAAAFEARVLELDRLRDRASRGSYDRFRRVMDKVPANQPAEEDRL